MRRIHACIVFLLSARLLPAQYCETFDGFINCGDNLFGCQADGGCAAAFTSSGWQNASGDDIDWSVSDLPTPSQFTGPDGDHTSGNGRYLFTEASTCYGQTAILLTPVYDITTIPNPQLQFWYHMYGIEMGSLTVEIEAPAGSGSWTGLWSLSDDQGPNWQLATVDLSAYMSSTMVRFRFIGITGSGFRSDMALDDICVDSPCLLVCDDSDPCTYDFCFNANCLYEVIFCDDQDLCTVDYCDNGFCAGDSVDCSDTDPCTRDYCDFGACFSDPPCEDNDDCTIDSCDASGVCHNTALNCDDHLSCTVDTCLGGFCFNVIICSDNIPCTDDVCTPGGCLNTPFPACFCSQPRDSVGFMAPSITDSIVVSGVTGIISDLNVRIDINHDWISDLDIELISPAGTSVILFNNQCGNEHNIKAVFDDEGYPLLCPPVSFLPAVPYASLSAYDGEAMNGTWKIRVTDGYTTFDDGILNQWCLIPELFVCVSSTQCDDGDFCTVDACNGGTCVHPPLSCDDGDACTNDKCVSGLCTHTPVNPGAFSSFMDAHLVIGQPDFTSNNSVYSQTSLMGPSYCAISAKGVLAVSLQGGRGIYLWNTVPAVNGAPADVVLGNPGFTAPVEATTQSLTQWVDGVAFTPDGDKLIASDAGNNRVLIWNSIPTVSGQPADVVLGQPNFISSTFGTDADEFDYPTGVFVSNDGKLIVADNYNNRVLIWNSVPTVSNTPADVVVGQPDFISFAAGNGANQMYRPWGVWVTPAGKLLVADASNNRVLIFNRIPAANGASADVVVGQTGFGMSAPGTSTTQLYLPSGVTVRPDGKMVISEFGNNRVLIYDTVPTVSGAAASVVLGQGSFTSGIAFAPSGQPARNNMYHPYNTSTDLYGRVFVTGRDMNRVMVFGDTPCDTANITAAISAVATGACAAPSIIVTFTITNAGPDTATGIIASIAVPSAFSIDSFSSSAGTYSLTTGYWKIPSLAARSATLTVHLTSSGSAGQVHIFSGSVLQVMAVDSDMTDNSASVQAISGVCFDNNACTSDTCVRGSCQYIPNTGCNVTLSGAIYTEAGKLVADVTVGLSGSAAGSRTTAADGLYSFDVAPGGSYTITPSKTNDAREITITDILLIQRHILGVAPLGSSYKLIAADVDRNRSPGIADMALMRALILQITSTFPGGRLWSFVPHDYAFLNPADPYSYPNSRTYPDLTASKTSQDFIAIRLGDVNDSWTPKTGAAGAVRFMIDDYHVLPGQEIIVPVTVKDFSNVAGYQFTLSWNAAVLRLLEVNNSTLNGSYGMQKMEEGFLTVLWNDMLAAGVNLPDDATVFEMKFKAIGGAGAYCEIKIGSELTASEAVNGNVDLLEIIPVNGMVKVGDITSTIRDHASLINLHIHPNPFTGTTVIIFSIPDEQAITLSVYDIFGREVKLVQALYQAGEHRLVWSGDDKQGNALSAGLYHLRLTAGNHSAGAKAVMIKQSPP